MKNLYDMLKEKGFYVEGHFVYCSTTETEDELCIDEAIYEYLSNKGYSKIEIEIMDCFNSPGYDCRALAVAWVNEAGYLNLESILLESY